MYTAQLLCFMFIGLLKIITIQQFLGLSVFAFFIGYFFCEERFLIKNKNKNEYTGLPTKDETSDTIELNLFCLFPCIQDSLQL